MLSNAVNAMTRLSCVSGIPRQPAGRFMG